MILLPVRILAPAIQQAGTDAQTALDNDEEEED